MNLTICMYFSNNWQLSRLLILTIEVYWLHLWEAYVLIVLDQSMHNCFEVNNPYYLCNLSRWKCYFLVHLSNIVFLFAFLDTGKEHINQNEQNNLLYDSKLEMMFSYFITQLSMEPCCSLCLSPLTFLFFPMMQKQRVLEPVIHLPLVRKSSDTFPFIPVLNWISSSLFRLPCVWSPSPSFSSSTSSSIFQSVCGSEAQSRKRGTKRRRVEFRPGVGL